MRPRKGWLEVTIGVLSLVALFLGAQVAAGVPGASWALIVLGVASAVLFAAFAPRLLHLSPGNPKLRAVWLTLAFLAVLMLGAAVLVLGEEPLTEWLGEERLDALVKLFVFGVIALFVILFGNIAPKIPFNRYMGLRLPWTVTDEPTWRVAHRLVGALAWPCGLAQLAIAVWLPARLLAEHKERAWLFWRRRSSGLLCPAFIRCGFSAAAGMWGRAGSTAAGRGRNRRKQKRMGKEWTV